MDDSSPTYGITRKSVKEKQVGKSEDSEVPWASAPRTGPLLRVQQAATYLGCSVATFYAMAADGRLPRPIKLTAEGRAAVVPQPWLDAVIAARLAEAAV